MNSSNSSQKIFSKVQLESSKNEEKDSIISSSLKLQEEHPTPFNQFIVFQKIIPKISRNDSFRSDEEDQKNVSPIFGNMMKYTQSENINQPGKVSQILLSAQLKKFISKLKHMFSKRQIEESKKFRINSYIEDKSVFYTEKFDKDSSVFSNFTIRNFQTLFVGFQDIIVFVFEMLFQLFTFGRIKNTFNPLSSHMAIYHIFYLFLFLLYILYLPVHLSFDLGFPEYIHTIISITVLFQIFIDLNTAFFKDGEVIEDRKIILHSYLFKGDFLLNVLAFLPYLTHQYTSFESRIVWQLMILLSSRRIFKHILFLEQIFPLAKSTKILLNLFKLICFILIMCHFFGCLWFLIGKISCKNQLNCWIINLGIENEGFATQYIMSFYWAVVTIMTVGYGDITPKNIFETQIAIVTIIFGGAIFMYNINYLGILIQEVSKENHKVNNYLSIINNFMSRKNIPNDLQNKIRHNINQIVFEESLYNENDEKEIIRKLPKNIREDLLLQANGSILNKMPFLIKNFSQETLTQLVYKMGELRYAPGDLVQHQQDPNYEELLIFVENGEIELFDLQCDPEKKKHLAVIKV